MAGDEPEAAGPEGPDGPSVLLSEAHAAFLGKVIHELRNAVASIVIQSSTLANNADAFPPEKLRRELVRLSAHSERLHALMERLLDLSRVRGTGHDDRAVKVADLVAEIVAADRLVRTVAGDERGPEDEIVVHVEDDLELVVDRLALDQIVGNLVRNARAHGGPNISIEARATADGVELLVSDDGPGIAAESVASLFEPFTRAGATAEGWGLGLAIVAELTRDLDGAVDFRPNEPHGATFRVSLPRADA